MDLRERFSSNQEPQMPSEGRQQFLQTSSRLLKRRVNKELWDLRQYGERLLSCRASKMEYVFLPIVLVMAWILIYFIIESNKGIAIEERLGQSYLKEYYLDQLNKERLHKLGEERNIQLRPSEVLNIIYAMPYVDTNPVIGAGHLKSLENIVELSSVPLHFHFLTNNKSEGFVNEIASRIRQKSSSELKHSILSIESFVSESQMRICPILSDSKEFCHLLIHQLSPLIFPYTFESVETAIYIDHRMTFTDDIGMLVNTIRALESGPKAISVAHEQSNRYMRSFGTWQRINPSTKLGKPPGDVSHARPGFNPSLMVLNLSKLRGSKTYAAFLNEKLIAKLINTYKYSLQVSDTSPNIDIGDALNLLAVHDETLFHTLDCAWNRRSDISLDSSDKKFNVCEIKTGTKAWNGAPNKVKLQRDQLYRGESIYISKNTPSIENI